LQVGVYARQGRTRKSVNEKIQDFGGGKL